MLQLVVGLVELVAEFVQVAVAVMGVAAFLLVVLAVVDLALVRV